MRLEFLTYPEIGRSMYVLYPAGDRLSCYENTLITILREDDSDTLPKSLLVDADFCKLADQQRFLLLFPNPMDGCWNWELDPDQRDDLRDVAELVRLFNHQEGFVDCGIYHNMHNARCHPIPHVRRKNDDGRTSFMPVGWNWIHDPPDCAGEGSGSDKALCRAG